MKSNFKEALTLFQNGQLNEAKDICLEILKAQSNNFDILHLLGLIAFQTKNYLKSAEIIDKAIQIKPDSDYLFGQLFHTKNSVCNWNFFKEDFKKNDLFLIDPNEKEIMSTIVYQVRSIPAALYKSLGGFATNGINITKILTVIPGI